MQTTLANYTRDLDELTKEMEEQYLQSKENHEDLEKLKLGLGEHIGTVKAIIDKFLAVCHHQCLIFQGRGHLHKHVASRRESKSSH